MQKRGLKLAYVSAAIMIVIVMTSVLLAPAFGAEADPATAVAAGDERPKIEVVFVLDTTGSMGGLIEGAKRKIWAILNQIASGKPAPDIRVGLIGYRDRTDAYVTKVYDLTDDLDEMYTKLTAFRAQGGGDTPESVNQALNEAVTKIAWSKGDKTLRVIFLVGDAPPHMDYQNDVKHPETCELAMKKGIIINAVQCGSINGTREIWKKIADSSEGTYVAIAQSGGVRAIATPYDEEIAKLDGELRGTAVYYGVKSERERTKRAASVAGAALDAAPAEAAADRVMFYSVRPKATPRLGRGGAGDLVEAIDAGSMELGKIKEAELSEEMKKMTADERKAFIAKRLEKRRTLKTKLDALNKKRAAHITAEMKKAPAKADAFDAKVIEGVRRHAEKIGVTYKK